MEEHTLDNTGKILLLLALIIGVGAVSSLLLAAGFLAPAALLSLAVIGSLLGFVVL